MCYKNTQIADFQVLIVAENLRRCAPRGGVWSSRGALYQKQEQQGQAFSGCAFPSFLVA
jgi:hypothetical protein